MSHKFYKALGLEKDAELADIKRAYRALVKTCQPDIAPGKQDEFDKITKAMMSYPILKNV